MKKNILTPPRPPTEHAVPATAAAESKHFDIVDLKQYFHVVVKRIWLVALCFVVALAIAVVMMVREVPVFSTTATILISGGLPVPLRMRDRDSSELGSDFFATQERIIRSSLLMQRAKERMGMPMEEVSRLLLNVGVNRIYQTSFISVSVTALDPVFAADFANTLAEEYIEFKAEERMDTSQATAISLTQQANRLREELKKAEERVVAFEKENKVIAISERGNTAAQILADLSSQAAKYRTDRMLLEAQQPLINQASDEIILMALSPAMAPRFGETETAAGARSGGSNDVMVTGQRQEMLLEKGLIVGENWQGLQREKQRLDAELAYMRQTYKDAHPLIQRNVEALSRIERDLSVEVQVTLQHYQANLDALAIKEKAAKRVELEWEDQAMEVSRKSHEYANLQRNVNRLQALYDLVFNRLKEIDISIGIEPQSIRLMERARPPGAPDRPRKMKKLFVVALIGLGVGLALVFGLEYIDDSIRYPDEVTRGMGLPFFGVIPTAGWDPSDLSSHVLANIDQKSGIAEAYRNVRSALLFSATNAQAKTIVLTSAVPREGKTTTALNLAISLAQGGARILLVDADMRRGQLHKYLGLEAGRGLSEMLAGQIKPESVIQRTRLHNLDLVATGSFPNNPAELLLRPEMENFTEYAKRTYDRVIFDCPPIMAVSEAGILCSLVDGVIFVVWAGQTSRKLARLALQILRERGATIMGCILNNLEFGRVGYYYYSTYYGYYDYHYEREPAAPKPG